MKEGIILLFFLTFTKLTKIPPLTERATCSWACSWRTRIKGGYGSRWRNCNFVTNSQPLATMRVVLGWSPKLELNSQVSFLWHSTVRYVTLVRGSVCSGMGQSLTNNMQGGRNCLALRRQRRQRVGEIKLLCATTPTTLHPRIKSAGQRLLGVMFRG